MIMIIEISRLLLGFSDTHHRRTCSSGYSSNVQGPSDDPWAILTFVVAVHALMSTQYAPGHAYARHNADSDAYAHDLNATLHMHTYA